MLEIILILLIPVTGFLCAYTVELQGTTLNFGREIGKAMVDIESIKTDSVEKGVAQNLITKFKINSLSKNGVQDIITPRMQNYRNILLPLLQLAILIIGSFVTEWYWALLMVFGTFIIASFIKRLIPSFNENSEYYSNIIKKDLDRKIRLYERKGQSEDVAVLKGISRCVSTLAFEEKEYEYMSRLNTSSKE